jgi:hypothetical protein
MPKRSLLTADARMSASKAENGNVCVIDPMQASAGVRLIQKANSVIVITESYGLLCQKGVWQGGRIVGLA